MFSPTDLKNSKVDFSVQVNSMNTRDEKRDQHLQSADFFDAAQYPIIHFVSDCFKKNGKDFIVYGKLTIKNKTQDIDLPFKITGETEPPTMKGTLILGLSTALKINRSTHGVGVGKWAADMVVGDNVDISVNMELNKMK